MNGESNQTSVDSINLIQLLKANSIPVKGLKDIYSWLEVYRESLQNALDKTDEFDIEGWSFLPKPGIRSRLKAIQAMITQLDKYSSSNKHVFTSPKSILEEVTSTLPIAVRSVVRSKTL